MAAPLRNPAIDLEPIHVLKTPEYRTGPGRRPKPHPAMPDLELDDAERALFDGFMLDFLEAFPDLSDPDYRMLWMAGTRYIAGLRLIKYEMKTGRTISMARQHPLVEMRALLDQLSVTRKARTSKGQQEDPDSADLKRALLALSQG